MVSSNKCDIYRSGEENGPRAHDARDSDTLVDTANREQ